MKFTLPEAHLIPPAFSDEVMDEAEDLVKVPRHELTKDLVHLTTAEHPTALDCSFGIHLSPGTEEGASQALGVSVVDTSIIDPKGKIAEEVLRRGGKCFTGKRSVPMLPDYLVEGRLSFAYESDQGPPVRDSITAEIDSGESSAEEGKASQEGLIWTPFKKTAATVLAALTYAEADEDVKDDDAREAPVLRRLQQIIEFARKTSQLGLAGVQSTRRKVRSRWAKTQLAMQMLRFMFNDAAMRFAEEHGIPILYTNQRANPRNDTEKNLVELYEADPERVKNQRAVRTAWRALGIEDSWSVKPLGHFFMQRERFAEFDSPLNNACL